MLYYEEYGDKNAPVLLLLHSGGMAGVEWKPQIESLSTRFRLIVPDLPAHGKSLLNTEKLSIDNIAEEIITLLDFLQIEKVAVCGSSMGGACALFLTLHHPQRIERAIIYRITYRKNSSTYAQTEMMASPDYWRQFGLHNWLAKIHTPQGDENSWTQVIARVSEALEPNTSVHNHSLEDLKRIQQPVLLVTGDRDPVAPLEDVLAMYRVIPNAYLWIMPNATHITATNTWRAAIFSEEIKRFLTTDKFSPKLKDLYDTEPHVVK